MSDILAEICAAKRSHVARKRREMPESRLLEEARHAPPTRGFAAALRRRADAGQYGLIAEIKKASPSKGVIRADFDPPRLAEAYAKGGAACLSVLTDIPYFQGDDAYLAQARAAAALPALRKDFMLEPYQIIESRALGADAVLLIMAALSDAQAAELFDVSQELSLDVLVEVHDERELERAAMHLPRAAMLGINNRSLRDFKTDLATSERLAKYVPASMLAVAESGVESPADLARLSACGISCFLVGESLMRAADVETATRTLITQANG